MKLQIALDTLDMDAAVAALDEIRDAIDVVEVGTPWIIREGLRPVAELKRRYPELTVLADLKIMDAGEYEAGLAFAVGADIVTVMAVAHDATVAGAVAAARGAGGKILADLLATRDPAARAGEAAALGVDYVCVHTGFDVQASCDPLSDLAAVSGAVSGVAVAVAGGINPGNIGAVARLSPALVVVGGALTGLAGKPALRETALGMKEALRHA